jgi:hypothetical protein
MTRGGACRWTIGLSAQTPDGTRNAKREATMGEYTTTGRRAVASDSAMGGYVFAGTMMVMIGVFQMFAGLAALIEDDFFVVTQNYAFDVDVTAWGWIHLLGGVLVALAGWGLFAAKTWARVVGIVLAVLSAVANFFFIPYYPFWSLLIIALCVWVIWSLTRPVTREEMI